MYSPKPNRVRCRVKPFRNQIVVFSLTFADLLPRYLIKFSSLRFVAGFIYPRKCSLFPFPETVKICSIVFKKKARNSGSFRTASILLSCVHMESKNGFDLGFPRVIWSYILYLFTYDYSGRKEVIKFFLLINFFNSSSIFSTTTNK